MRRHYVVPAFVLALLPTAFAPAATAAGPAPWAQRDNGQIHACTGSQPTPSAVLCVRAGAAPGGSGTASAPLPTIAAAIAAAKAGDIVQVAAGTYPENVAVGSFASQVDTPLTLLGGFAPAFTVRDAGVHVATIDGGLLAPAVQLHVSSNQTTTLDGFRITNGRGLGSSWQDGGGHGGGVYARQGGNGAMVISNNRIEGNRSNNHTSADSRGGGIHAESQAWGGATATLDILDNHVRGNLAGKGAGINVVGRHALLLRNRVEDNIGHNDHGGGIYISTAATQVRDNLVLGNVIGASAGYGWGGGILVAAAAADLQGNLITDNHAPTTGAGIFWDEGATGSMRNDLVVGNRCPAGGRSGAGIYLDGGPGGPSIVTMENITVADHPCPGTAPDGATVVVEAGSIASFRNAIFWGNTRDFATLSGGSFSIVHSITQQAGTGNFSADPLFADAAGGDYHLRSAGGRFTASGWVHDAATSPGVDAGDPASAFALEPQPNGGRINLGAYGNTAQASRSPGVDALFAADFEP
jgi:hypothetical protein